MLLTAGIPRAGKSAAPLEELSETWWTSSHVTFGNTYFRLPLPHVLVRKSKRNARRSTNRTVSKTRNIPGVC